MIYTQMHYCILELYYFSTFKGRFNLSIVVKTEKQYLHSEGSLGTFDSFVV